jgi:ACS family glucarate transporter-like MFS transporter
LEKSFTPILACPKISSALADQVSSWLGKRLHLRQIPYSWLIVGLLCAISAVSYLERVNVSAVGTFMMRDLQLDQPMMGQLFSAFLLGYALCQYPAGLLADRFGPRRVLGFALFGWGICTVLTAMVKNLILFSWLRVFPTLLAIRFLLGVFESPTYPGAGRTISRWVGPTGRAQANAIVIAGISIGSALTPPLMAHLATAWGWQMALLLIAGPAFALAIVWLIYARDEPAEQTRLAPAGPRGAGKRVLTWLKIGGSARQLLTNKNLWVLTSSYALQGYISYIFVFWFFLYLVEVRHFDMLEGSWLATMPWLLALVTTPVGGVISDLLVRRLGYPWGRRLWPMLAMQLAAVLLFVGARAERPYFAVALLTLCQGLVMSVEGAFWASMIEVAPEHAGAGGGILNMGGNLGGFLSPTVTPLVAASFGWVPALDIGAGLSVLGAFLWCWVTFQPRAAPAPSAARPAIELTNQPFKDLGAP